MTIFIKPEYIIANILLELKTHNKHYISINLLIIICAKLQQTFNQNNIDAVILYSHDKILEAVNTYPQYFRYENIQEPIISLQSHADINKLENRFRGYLPIETINILTKHIPDILTSIYCK